MTKQTTTNSRYEEAIAGFKLISPTYGTLDGKTGSTSKHRDGRTLYEEMTRRGHPLRAWMIDKDGRHIGAWRYRRGRDGGMISCTVDEYRWGF